MAIIATNNSTKRLLRLFDRFRKREIYTKLEQIDQGAKRSSVPNTAQANNAVAIFPHGWSAHTSGSDPPFSSSGLNFTIDRDSTIFIQAVETAVDGDTVALTANALNLVYYDTSGVLQKTTTIPTQSDFHIQVWMFYVLTDAANVIYVGDERHGVIMDVDTHFHFHETIGTLYEEGLALSGLDIADTGANPDAAQGAISDGEIHDEDIEIEITDGAGTGRWEQELDPTAEIPIFYRTGASGDWRKIAATTWFVDPADGANRANYNDPDGGGGGIWGLTTVAQNAHLAMWIFATNEYNEPIAFIMGQETHTTFNQAKDGNQFADLLFGDFPFSESRVLYRIIFQTSTAYGNTAKARAREILDFRQQTIGGNQNALAGSHLGLSGLNGGTYGDGNHQNLVPVHIEASTDPTVNDDVDLYKVGTIWKRTDNNNLWICTDNTDGAAVWKNIWPASGGDVTGPGSSTDNAIVRFDGTGGKTLQDSSVTITDTDDMTIPGFIDVDGNVQIRNQNELRLYDNGNYIGLEAPALSADQIWVWPDADGAAGQVLTTDGAGTFSFSGGPKKGRTKGSPNLQGIDPDFILVNRVWQDESVSTFASQSDDAHTITVSTIPEPLGTMTGTVTINGKNAAGDADSEVITINDAANTTHETAKAFRLITSVVADQTDATTISLYSVGLGDGVGLPIPITAQADVFAVTKNGAHIDAAGYTVDATNSVVNFLVSFTTGDDLVIWYQA